MEREHMARGRLVAAIPFVVFLASGFWAPPLTWGRPDCEEREARALQKLEKALTRCAVPGCADAARERCEEKLTHFGCDPRVCEPLLGVGAALSCPADTLAAENVINTLLTELTPAFNKAWPSLAVALKLDPLTPVWSGQINLGCVNGGDVLCGLQFATCDKEYADLSVKSITGLSALQFDDLSVVTLDQDDVSAHSNRGPDAGLITDGVFAAEGTTWNHPAYAVVLPLVGRDYGLTIDLGALVTVCGNGVACKSGPILQADKNVFQLDYSTDGVTWVKYGQFPAVSGSGLLTRPVAQITPGSNNPNFTARYVRVWAVSGNGDYSVSELKLYNASSQLISVRKPAVGPRPFLITDGVFAPEGTTWNHPSYAVVLPKEGATHALAIDLGAVVTVCGNGASCQSGPVLQADKNVFQLDYSTDGVTWTKYGQFPAVSGSGLRTRPVAGSSNSNFPARYVRVWAVSGNGDYSVSELKLYNAASAIISTGKPTFGPEPFITNGEFAPEGADWDDPRYATRLGLCAAAPNNSVCPPMAVTAPVIVDLGESLPISQLKLQADRHTFQVDLSTDGTAWKPLWQIPSVSFNGLTTRSSQVFVGFEGRYLRVYGIAGDDNNYSVSELQVLTFKPDTRTPCSYDASADSGNNVACTYQGQFEGNASLISASAVITGVIDKAKIKVKCSDFFGISSWTETLADAGQVSCTIQQPVGIATVNFCAGSCASGSPVTTLSYAQIDKLKFGAPRVKCDVDNAPGWLTDILVPVFKDDVIEAITPPIQDALNSLLDEFIPFPSMCTP
jgi:hypothetical protein